MSLLQISIPMSLEFDDLSIVRENPTEEMQSNNGSSSESNFNFIA